jgi:adenine-specific DNA-methyltransferase
VDSIPFVQFPQIDNDNRRPDGLPALGNMEVVVQGCPSEHAERLRQAATKSLDPGRRSALGQYFTPPSASRLIASMLDLNDAQRVRLLDPGAGVGSLTAAAVEHLADHDVRELEVVAWEVDETLHDPLCATLQRCAAWAADRGLGMRWELRRGDYIEATAAALAGELGTEVERFDAIVMNPPYRKVNGGAPERLALERVGLPITNLYTAFLALSAAQLERGGVLAAITPRSFANGPYAAPFRRFFFDRVGIERLHLFKSRAHVFADADVLQENLIFATRQGKWPAKVSLSFSQGLDDARSMREVPVEEILRRDDPQLFLRIPGEERDTEIASTMAKLPFSLEGLEVAVSTGKVVEFRARENLRSKPEPGAAPLIRPNHLKNSEICWPDPSARTKPNAVAINHASEKLLLPNETYVLVKRLTAKEEPRRVRAAVCHPSVVPGHQIAFENHLNVFHRGNRGLPDNLAYGLAAYLNSSFVDLYVRQFNGHTQVNAADLRHLRYPSPRSLAELGMVLRGKPAVQEELDSAVELVVRDSTGTALQEAA